MYPENRFVKVADFYNDNAFIQRRMGEELVSYMRGFNLLNFDKVFEIGCGTGLFTNIYTKEIKYQVLYLNDVKNFVKINIAYKFIAGDIEKITIDEQFNLVISNAVFQWINNISELFDKLHKITNKSSTIAFTTFGPKNLYQIKDILGIGLDYLDYESYKKLLNEKFKIILAEEKVYDVVFPNVKDILKHFKYTGVNGVERTRWSKRDYNFFINAYEKYKNSYGYLLTYNPFYFIVKRR